MIAREKLFNLKASLPSDFKRSASSSGVPCIYSTSFERIGPDFWVGGLIISTSSMGSMIIN